MSSQKMVAPRQVAAFQSLRPVVVDAAATCGAQIGVNLLLPDGTLGTLAKLRSLFGATGTASASGTAIDTTDDLEEGQFNYWFTDRRAQDAVGALLADTATITLTYAPDTSITATLKDLADSGTGAALVKLTRDSKGRISGTSSASTTDLAEGSNLYYTDARAAAAAPVQSVNGYAGAVTLTAADVGAATTAQGAKADSAVQSGGNVSVLVNDIGYLTDAPSDGSQYARKDGGWVVVAGGGGSGDVVGPAASTDGNVALFDGTTGKLLKDGGSFGSLVRAAVLTGLSTATSAVIAATDSVLAALGKLQAQITDNLLPKGYIDGLQMQWVSGTAITVTSGAAYIEGSSKVLRATSAIAKTGLSLTASIWYHIYLYDNAGTPAVEVVTTAPASPYNGTARSKTGDTSRRYLGSVLTNASGSMFNFVHFVGGSKMLYMNDLSGAPFTVVNGAATSATSVSCAAVIPITGTAADMTVINSDTSTVGGAAVLLGTNAVVPNPSPPNWIDRIAVGISTNISMVLGASQTFQYMFNVASPTGNFVARVKGYGFER